MKKGGEGGPIWSGGEKEEEKARGEKMQGKAEDMRRYAEEEGCNWENFRGKGEEKKEKEQGGKGRSIDRRRKENYKLKGRVSDGGVIWW